MKPNKKYKDSVFSALFNNPDALRELYSAIEGISIPPDKHIDINTLTDVLIRGRINDLSFTIDKRLVVLTEQQSTISENLPLRLLEYVARVYEKIIDNGKRFQVKLQKIPRPEFIVLYNGKEQFPDHQKLKLSTAFMDVKGLKQSGSNELPLELIVNVYNINQGYNPGILKKSVILESYSILISKIWELLNSKLPLDESLKLAIKYCINNNILKDFLKKHSKEIYGMLYCEYRFEDELAAVKEEAREDAWNEAWNEAWGEAWNESSKQEKILIAKKSLSKGLNPELIKEITGLDLETIQLLNSD